MLTGKKVSSSWPLGLALVGAAAYVLITFVFGLLVEMRIDRFGVDAHVEVLSVHEEAYDDDRGDYVLAFVKYGFRTEQNAPVFGEAEMNEIMLPKVLGKQNNAGQYPDAICRYVPSNPAQHRLSGWGYDGMGPPGGLLNMLFRLLLSLGSIYVLLAFAYAAAIQPQKGQ